MFQSGINLDLLTVGVSVAGTGLLGFVVYFSNRKSLTNKIFFIFSMVTLAWGVTNYLNYNINNDLLILWTIRFVIFFAVLQSLSFFTLMFVFPQEVIIFPKWFKIGVIPIAFATAILTLTPYVFSSITRVPGDVVSHPVPASGIFIFIFVALSLVISGFVVILRKLNLAKDELRSQINLIVVGVLIMFTSIILFNLILPVMSDNTRYIPLGALFTFPFVIFTAVAILKRHLATAVLVFILSVVLLVEVIFSETLLMIIFRGCVFFLFLVFGINLIRSVIKEIRQRERLEVLRLKLEQSNSDLENANEKLKGLDKLKSEFVSLASHQLRSPLTAIKGYASMVVDGDYGEVNKEAKDAISRIYESSQNLAKIVEDLLNVSKIEQGGMKYDMAPFDMNEVAESVTKELSIVAEGKGLKMNFLSEGVKDCMVNGDKDKIRQVVINFVDNSIKYTKTGEINVKVEKVGDKVLFSVKDTGMGMTPEIKATLFQKFARGEGARMNTSGTGLGLYLTKEISEAHGGRVYVESEGMGKGSTFFMELGAVK